MNRKYLIAGIAIVTIALIAIVLALAVVPHSSIIPVVFIVYDAGKGDLSYTDSAYRGLFAAQESMRFDKKEFTSLNYSAFPELPGDPAGAKIPGLIITVGYDYTAGTKQLAQEHPGIQFLAIDQAGTGRNNLRTCEISSYGESYLAGVLAATATKTHRVGIILGSQSDLLEGFRQGYVTGVHAVNSSITVDQLFVRENSTAGFSDPDRAAEIAAGFYRNGTDVIYTVAGYSGTGAIAEAKKEPGRYIIGVDSDQTDLGPSVVLASAIKRVDRVVYTGIEQYLGGTFTGGSTITGLHEGITGLSYNPEFVSFNATVFAWEGRAEAAEDRYLANRR